MERERFGKMFLEAKNKSSSVVVVVAGLVALVVCLVVAGVKTPNMIKSRELKLYNCALNFTDNCFVDQNSVDVVLTITDIKKKNQFIYFEFTPHFDLKSVRVQTLFIATASNDDKDFVSIKNINDTYKLTDGNSEALVYIPYTNYETYTFNLTINSNSSGFTELDLKVTYMEIDYYNFLIATKYVFLVLTVLNFAVFVKNAWPLRMRSWRFETGSVVIMNLSLFVYNEPLIGAYTEFFGVAYSAISMFCNVQFLCALVLFWIFLLQKLIFPKIKLFLYFVECFFVAALFAFYFSVYLFVEGNLLYYKTVDVHHFESSYIALFQVLIAILVLIGAWVLGLMIFGFRIWISMDFRYKVYWVVNHCMVVLTFVFAGFGYFRLMDGGQIVLSVVAVYNIYFWVMLWMCTPHNESYQKDFEEYYKKDNEVEFQRIDNQA